MRLQSLVNLLTQKERETFQDWVIDRKRNSLLRLWDFIEKQPEKGDWNKEKLFLATFEEEYFKEKDYLLRNEMRILSSLIVTFINRQESELVDEQNEISQFIMVLKRMLRVGKVDEFESILSEAIRNTEKLHEYEKLAKLLDLKSNWQRNYHEVSMKNYSQIIENLQLQKELILKDANEKTNRIEVGVSFAKRVVKSLSDVSHKQSDLPAPMKKDPIYEAIINYYRQLGESYSLSGLQKINCLKSLIKVHPELVKFRPVLQKDIHTLYGNIGLEYFLMEEYEQANQFYSLIINGEKSEDFSIDILFNYCVNLLMLQRYKEFTKKYNSYKTQIESNEKLKHRFQYFNAISLLFLKKPETAFKLLTQDISQRPVNEYYYYRMVYAMVFFQLGDTDNALREIDNILQSFRFRKNANVVDKPLVKLIQRLILAQTYKDQKEKFKKEINVLDKQLKKERENNKNTSTVIHRWIAWQIELLQKKKT